jgi:signal transduction histidine kinase
VHPLLARQLRQASRETQGNAPDLHVLTDLISASYAEHERDRRLNERAATLMEDELRLANSQAQAQMQSLLNALIHGMKESVLVARADGIVELANSAAEVLFGRPANALCSLKAADLFQRSNGTPSGPASGAIRSIVPRSDDDDVPVEINLVKIDGADGVRTLWLVRDISEQVRWAAQLEDNRKRTEDFATISSDWFWQCDETLGGIEIYGDAPIGAGVALRDALAGRKAGAAIDGAVDDLDSLCAALRARQEFRELRIATQLDNEARWIALRARPLFGKGGVFLGFRGSARDATAAQAHEDELHRAREAADEANKLKSHFLATMSHELRTPMNAILGFSEVIRDQLFGPDAQRYAEYAANIHQSGKHLLSLINDILDLSKIEAGNYILDPEPVQLGALVEDCRMMLAPQAVKGQVILVADVPKVQIKVSGDRRALRQIVINLLSNGVKFTPAGGAVTLRLTQESGMAVLSVTDTGIGISPDFLPFVFEPFRQQDSGLARKFEGTGLGLAITKRLTEGHGGTVSISSAEGVGTCVTVRLPLLAAGAATAAA